MFQAPVGGCLAGFFSPLTLKLRVGEIFRCAKRRWVYVGVVDWQQVISLVIVAVAAAALGWRQLRRRKFSFGRYTHCGCSMNEPHAAQRSIVFQARKGERSKVLVKMK